MRPFVVVDAEQRTPAWYAARLGRLTGSVAGDMLATVKSGEAAARRNLRLRLVLERLTRTSQDSDFVSPAMQAGIDREEFAFRAYEALTGDLAVRVGFCQHSTLMAGCSPDGHLGDFAKLLSIKCRQPAAHYEFIKSGKIPADAFAQIRHELWITGAADCDYFSWNPDFEPALQSRIVTVTRTEAAIPEYEAKALAFLAEVDTDVLAMRTLANPAAQLAASIA
jgi:hypothetical protein